MLKQFAICIMVFMMTAQIAPYAHAGEDQPTYFPGELIIKFKGDMAEVISKNILTKTPVTDGTIAGKDFLTELNLEFHVVAIEPRYPSLRENGRLIRSIDRARKIRKKLLGLGKYKGKKRRLLLDETNLDTSPKLENIYKLYLDQKGDMYKIAETYSRQPGVEYAQPNFIYRPDTVPNDPDYPEQWHHAKIKTNTAWDKGFKGRNVVVGIVDYGVEKNHKDLAANVGCGFNAYDEASDTTPDINPDTGKLYDHGTYCAGIVAAQMNNNFGVVGIAPEATIMPLKVAGAVSGKDNFDPAIVANAYQNAVNMGVDILNLSFGAPASFDSEGQDVINNIKNSNPAIIFVASAGNEHLDSRSYPHFPSGFKGVLSVAATTRNDTRWGNSNYGKDIDIAAPGQSILSTTAENGIGSANGTSASAPIVAGTAALLLSKNPSLTAEDVEKIILHGVDRFGIDIPAPDHYIGAGRINIAKVMDGADLDLSGHHAVVNAQESDYVSSNTSAIIEVQGNASDKWILQIGRGAYPTKWTTINSGTLTGALVRSILSIDTRQFDNGLYTVKLTVQWSERGKTQELIDTAQIKFNRGVRIKNKWTGCYLHLANRTGKVECSDLAQSNTAGHWIIEDLGDGTNRIKNAATGDYLHIENNQQFLEYGKIKTEWWSARWNLEEDQGFTRISNQWKPEKAIHVEHQIKINSQNASIQAECSAIEAGWWSAQWQLEEVK